MINYNYISNDFQTCINNIDFLNIIDLFNIEDLILEEKRTIEERKCDSFYYDFILNYNNDLKQRLSSCYSQVIINSFNYDAVLTTDITIQLPDINFEFEYVFSKNKINRRSLMISFKIKKNNFNFEYQLEFFFNNNIDEEFFRFLIEENNKTSFCFINNTFILFNDISFYNKYKNIIIFNIYSDSEKNIYNFISLEKDGVFSVYEYKNKNSFYLAYNNNESNSINEFESFFDSFDELPDKINEIIKLSKINNVV